MKGISDLVDIARESLEIQKQALSKLGDMEKILRDMRVRLIEKLP